MHFRLFGIAGIAAALMATPVNAHHSFAMFDGEETVTLDGRVTEFQWTYPHAWILIMVGEEGGGETRWAFELPSPGGLARNGWLPNSLEAGMEVTISAHPLRDGQPGGSCLTVTLPDGTVLEGP
jgi:hypothetical protein